ncbi:MAG: hypothetical protein ACJA0H_000761, partial [Francisellaceae bacterium]
LLWIHQAAVRGLISWKITPKGVVRKMGTTSFAPKT